MAMGAFLWISSSTAAFQQPTAFTAARSNNAQKHQPMYMTASTAAIDARGGEGESGGTATIPNEVFNLVKSIVGAGVLSLPAGIAAFGNAPSAMIPAAVLIALMGGISAITFAWIGRVCAVTDSQSYSEAWDKTVGEKSSWVIALSCVVDCFLGNLSYSMILSDTFVALLASIGFAVTRSQSLLGVTGLVLLPLCLMKNLSSLAPFSLVGIMGMIYTTVAMAIRYFGKDYAAGGKFADSVAATPTFGTSGASAVLSVNALILTCRLSNAYIAHFNAPKFYRELKNNTLPRFYQVVGWSFGISIALYSIISAMGFLTFGAASNGLILNNYSTKDVLMSFSRIAVTISLLFSYPLLFVGTRDGLLDLFKVPNKDRSVSVLNKYTFGILGVVTALVSQLTDLGLVSSIGGATCGTSLVFIYPAIMLRRNLTSQGKKMTGEGKLAGLIALGGVLMGTIGTIVAVRGA